jgi:hypothetical protein
MDISHVYTGNNSVCSSGEYFCSVDLMLLFHISVCACHWYWSFIHDNQYYHYLCVESVQAAFTSVPHESSQSNCPCAGKVLLAVSSATAQMPDHKTG